MGCVYVYVPLPKYVGAAALSDEVRACVEEPSRDLPTSRRTGIDERQFSRKKEQLEPEEKNASPRRKRARGEDELPRCSSRRIGEWPED
jgi:hypothetical protein